MGANDDALEHDGASFPRVASLGYPFPGETPSRNDLQCKSPQSTSKSLLKSKAAV